MNTTGFAPLACEPAASTAAQGSRPQAGLVPATATEDFAACLEDELPQPSASEAAEAAASDEAASAPETIPIVPDQVLYALLWASCQIPTPVVPPPSAPVDVETSDADVTDSASVPPGIGEGDKTAPSHKTEQTGPSAANTPQIRTAGSIELPSELVEIPPVDAEVLALPKADMAVPNAQIDPLGRNIPVPLAEAAESAQSSEATLGQELPVESKSSVGSPKKPLKSGDLELFSSSRQARELAGTSIAKPISDMPAQMPKDQNQDARPVMTGVPVSASAVVAQDLAQAGLVSALDAAADRSGQLPPSAELVPDVAVGSTERVEKLQELVTREVRFFRQSGAQILEMVVEPAPDTKVRLHLELQAGRVEAVLSCEGGDQSWLQSHWAELQDSLSGQGVTLRSFEAGTSNDSRPPADAQFGSRQEERPRAQFNPESLEMPKGNTSRTISPTVATARKAEAGTRQLLEYWA